MEDKKFIVKVVFSFLCFFYLLNVILFNDGYVIFLDEVNFFIHEGGHVIFMLFGNILYFLGGSLTQILIPVAFVIYFAKLRKFYSSTICLYWVAINFVDVSIYISDARSMRLNLFGGNIHDWNYLLTKFRILEFDKIFGNILYAIGIILMSLAFILSYMVARQKYE